MCSRRGAEKARVAKAEDVCVALRRYDAAQADEYTKQSAHVIIQKSVAMALCYDVRVNPYRVVGEAVERLRAVVLHTASVVYDVRGPLLDGRARLPGRCGGLTLRSGSEAEAAAAYWASWTTHRSELTVLMQKLGWPVPHDP